MSARTCATAHNVFMFLACPFLSYPNPPAMQDTIPRNIFELGLKSHLGQPGLVLAYADFLLGEQLSITQLLINRQGDGAMAAAFYC